MLEYDDLYGPVSFGGGGGGGGGGGSDSRGRGSHGASSAVDNHIGRNTAMNGRDPTQPGYNAPFNPNIDFNNNGSQVDDALAIAGIALAVPSAGSSVVGAAGLAVAVGGYGYSFNGR